MAFPEEPGRIPTPAPPPPAAVRILLGGGIIRGYRDITPAMCSPGTLAPIGSNRGGCWSVPALPPASPRLCPLELPLPLASRRRRRRRCPSPLPAGGESGSEASSKPGEAVDMELPHPQPAKSPASDREDDGDRLAGREAVPPPPPPLDAVGMRPYLCGLVGTALGGPMAAPGEAALGGPGGPMAGSGRSQDRHRNLELRREARTAEMLLPALSSLLPGAPVSSPPPVMRAASLAGGGDGDGGWRGRRGGGVVRVTRRAGCGTCSSWARGTVWNVIGPVVSVFWTLRCARAHAPRRRSPGILVEIYVQGHK